MRFRILAGLLVLAAAACRPAPQPDGVPLYDNLGSLHRKVTTSNEKAQKYFDQGLRLYYGFNSAESARAFAEAARLDSACAMCWWGLAMANGPNINIPMDSAGGVAAYHAATKAGSAAGANTPVERDLVEAITLRYGAAPLADRAARDSAYFKKMDELAAKYPQDADVLALSAEAAMLLRPWNYWQPDGSPYPGTNEFLTRLESALTANPNNPGACHFYIHAVEASNRPERALPCAERLASLIPGAGHLVHMPAHIYIRLGMYDKAYATNEHAAHTDESYIADQHPDGLYPMAYYPHNLHFLWASAAFEGRKADADSAMQRLRAKVTPEMAHQFPPLEILVVAAYYHEIWFSEWDAILAEPRPPTDLVTAGGMWHYTRGRAFAATGRFEEARHSLDSLSGLRKGAASHLPPGMTVGFAPPAALLAVAENTLAGEIAAGQKHWSDAIARLSQAARLEDEMAYDEPADWYPPVRWSLGAALLGAGRAADAEAAYRADLVRHPHNGWALTGLARALEAQGKTADAASTRDELSRVASRADVEMR